MWNITTNLLEFLSYINVFGLPKKERNNGQLFANFAWFFLENIEKSFYGMVNPA